MGTKSTSVHYAIQHNRADILRVLFKAATVDVLNNRDNHDKSTPLEFAVRLRHGACVNVIREFMRASQGITVRQRGHEFDCC